MVYAISCVAWIWYGLPYSIADFDNLESSFFTDDSDTWDFPTTAGVSDIRPPRIITEATKARYYGGWNADHIYDSDLDSTCSDLCFTPDSPLTPEDAAGNEYTFHEKHFGDDYVKQPPSAHGYAVHLTKLRGEMVGTKEKRVVFE
jgi:hypothetical protein